MSEGKKRAITACRIVAPIALFAVGLWALVGCYLAFGVLVGLAGPEMPWGNRVRGGSVCVLILAACIVAIAWVTKTPKPHQ